MSSPEAELTRLHAAHAVAVHRFAWSITKDESMADDVLQEVFVKLAHDLSLDYLRREQRRAARDDRWQAELPNWFEPSPTHDDDREHLTAALTALPEEQRTAVHLHVWEQMSFAAIADLQGVPLQTVASRYRYALGKLRQALQDPLPIAHHE
jgi:RNA polymerase sigma-70 factor, ECF subfamily